MIGTVIEWLELLMAAIGAPGAGLAVLLENVFPPIPSELILPLAGFAASQGHFSVLAAIVWTTLGSTLGAWLLYWAGHALGIDRLRWIADRLPLASSEDIDHSMGWFERNGAASVLFGRMIPGIRSLISVPAGLNHMSPLKFTTYTLLGSLVWNSILVVAGHQLGANWEQVGGWVSSVQDVVAVVVAAAVLVFVGRRVLHRRQDEAADR